MGGEDTELIPGDGPSSGISITLTAGTLEAIRRKVGKRGVSAYLEQVAQRQIERDNLDELIGAFEGVHGPADPGEVAAARARLADETRRRSRGERLAGPGAPRGHRDSKAAPAVTRRAPTAFIPRSSRS